jgi:hypothetical protein
VCLRINKGNSEDYDVSIRIAVTVFIHRFRNCLTRSIAMPVLVVTVLSFASQVLDRCMLCNVNKLLMVIIIIIYIY